MPTFTPITADIPDVAAAKTNFDGITYAKGSRRHSSSCMRGLEGCDSTKVPKRYFDKHRFGVVAWVTTARRRRRPTGSWVRGGRLVLEPFGAAH